MTWHCGGIARSCDPSTLELYEHRIKERGHRWANYGYQGTKRRKSGGFKVKLPRNTTAIGRSCRVIASFLAILLISMQAYAFRSRQTSQVPNKYINPLTRAISARKHLSHNTLYLQQWLAHTDLQALASMCRSISVSMAYLRPPIM